MDALRTDGGGQDNIEMLKVQIICWAAILITTLHRYHPILVVIVKFILVCNLVILLLPKYFFVNNQNASHPGQWPTGHIETPLNTPFPD